MTDVVMPQMGESIVEGTLTKWLKKPGDRVERDEPLFEISTDKVDTEIPSPAAGTLGEVLVEEGKTVGINTVVARIDEGGGAAAKPAAQPAAQQAPPAPPAAAPAPPAAPPKPEPTMAAAETMPPTPAPQQVEDTAQAGEPAGPLSPLVRKMARENNIDLNRVKGTGAGGRITKQDVEAYLSSGASQAPKPAAPQAPAPQAPPPQPPPQQAPPQQQQFAPLPPGGAARTRIEPMSTMRIKIAEHMVMSKHTSAHVTTIHRVDMTAVAKTRERNKSVFQQQYGFSLTYLPFITRAAVAALRQYPLLNASLDNNNIIYHNEINIGIAVALEGGLIVPVIRAADEKNVLGLQRSIVDLATRARSRQLKPDEVVGGTFSITNFGSFGSMIGTPVINQPQVAILGVGTVDKTPVVIDDAIAIRSICHLSLSFDHRLIDGALADQFMTRLKQVLEGWSEEVL
ncbi:MAG TPA: 2-oxoglutarate dehydrogenase, E2 component, dihydrolipoamide succinyltransferase [Candidatus Limnocylindrales bacterium]|nr:2-oxoglutarate dehydrogenase, E2 component, dihydrolipoamide succinyltransferase [Candidatus Limnocylindrales bacterium]